eukprot:355102-Chlamydomonas_euryale.AAC.4
MGWESRGVAAVRGGWSWCAVDGAGARWMELVRGGWSWCAVDGAGARWMELVRGGWSWCAVDGAGAGWMELMQGWGESPEDAIQHTPSSYLNASAPPLSRLPWLQVESS